MAIEYDPEKLLKSLTGESQEKEGGLFSAFRPPPAPEKLNRPAPAVTPPPAPVPPPPPKVPAPAEKVPVQDHSGLDARLAAIEKKLEESLLRRPQPQDQEMLDYLKQKINDLEKKLLEAQEKGLAFAYEVKGREEARKESRREMEEFLAEVKRQQVDSESERARALELEKARGRIEALETKIMDLAAPPPPLKSEVQAEELAKLAAGLKAELLAGLEGESLAREKDKGDLRLLANNIANKVLTMESAFSKRFAEMEVPIGLESGKIASVVKEFSSGLRDVAAGIEASRLGISGMVEGAERALQAGGTSTTARRLVEAYDLGFITACLNNLEKVFCTGAETLGRAASAARQASDPPGTEAALIARRHAAILDSAARDLASALEVFRGVRQETLKPLKKIIDA